MTDTIFPRFFFCVRVRVSLLFGGTGSVPKSRQERVRCGNDSDHPGCRRDRAPGTTAEGAGTKLCGSNVREGKEGGIQIDGKRRHDPCCIPRGMTNASFEEVHGRKHGSAGAFFSREMMEAD